MASPESVKMGSAVAPVEPEEVTEADVADPGEVETTKFEQRQSQSGKYGSTPVESVERTPEDTTSDPNDPDGPPQTTWIDIELVDTNNKPVAGEPYQVTDSQNRVAAGTLDNHGKAHITGVAPGTCRITFPRLDARGWKKA